MKMELVALSDIITKTVLNAGSTSMTIPLFSLSGTEHIFNFSSRVKTAFAGVTYPEVRVGYSDDLERFVARQAINRTGDLITGAIAASSVICPKQHPDHVKTEAFKQIIATFSSTTGNFSSLSAGSIDFVILYAKNID